MTTISIITICFNNLKELIETCESVEAQTQRPAEHIIIDGSSDEEIIIWLKNDRQPDYRRWIHERDKGISDAFNKGINNCCSSIIHILNSGDKYFTGTAVEIVRNCFDEDPQLMWTHSQYVQHRGNVNVISGAPFAKDKLWKGMRTVAHPTMFIKKEVYERHGLYNTDFKIAMDYDILVRIRNERFRFIPKPLVYFAPGGTSGLYLEEGLEEVRRSYNTHLGYSSRLSFYGRCGKRFSITSCKQLSGKWWFRLKNRKQITY
jgi:glycosyltransferase involved in cell wall biosynthesis